MTLQGMGKGKIFYCRYKEENSQKHLEESRADREKSRFDQTIRELGAEQRERNIEKWKERQKETVSWREFGLKEEGRGARML